MNLDSRASRWATAVLLVGAGVVAVLPVAPHTQFLDAQSAKEISANRWAFDVAVGQSDPVLACPSGIADPLEPESLLARPTVWTSAAADEESLDGGGTLVLPVPPGQAAAEGTIPLALSAAGLTEGEGRSLLITGCVTPMRQLALVGGSTVVGEDALLTIVNPGSQPTHVNIEAFGAAGPLGGLPQPLIIPARSTATWMPAAWFPDEDRLALVLSVDSGGVAAWMQSSGRDGEVPRGMAQIAARPLSKEAVFPGVSEAAGTPVLRLVNPGKEELPVRVATTSDGGSAALPGTEGLRVAPGAIFEISLSGIGTDPTAVVASAESPFSASVAFQVIGEADPLVRDRKVEARTLVAPATAARQAQLPTEADLVALARSQGFDEVEVALTIANLGDASVTVAGEAIPAGASRTWTGAEIDRLGGGFAVGEEVYIGLRIWAQTDLGPVLSFADLGAGGTVTGTATVYLGP